MECHPPTQPTLAHPLPPTHAQVRHLAELLSYAEVAPAVNQVECHPRWQVRALVQQRAAGCSAV